MLALRRPVLITALAGVLGTSALLGFATRPLTAPRPATVEMGAMTWIEVRDEVRSGITSCRPAA
jgi:hypothetical protein